MLARHHYEVRLKQFSTATALYSFDAWDSANPYSTGIYFRRQILTFKVDPCTEGVQIFIMAVDLQHR